jgi:hypothetical protein
MGEQKDRSPWRGASATPSRTLALGILELHALGWRFEANVGEMKSQLEKNGMESQVCVTLEITSASFPLLSYERSAVKVVDAYGNESAVVRKT